MQHVMFDGFQGLRSRLDDIRLTYEILEELPVSLGLQPVMPPFILPYYNGVVPEDCGISAFVFLAGGHFTLHTFSLGEAIFADILSPIPFDKGKFVKSMQLFFSCKKIDTRSVQRSTLKKTGENIDIEYDFGPHLFLDFKRFKSPWDFEELFSLFDRLPASIGMTPIMRPFLAKSRLFDGQPVISVITMIAESHISMHLFPGERKAFFDLFSCSFFDKDYVIPILLKHFKGTLVNNTLSSRGRNYKSQRTKLSDEITKSRAWLSNIHR
ncbi:MAG: S-adenosylmethionine decarboxylase [Candidatus Aminicenantes bacterium]|nr:S-adenosylmethionine decarboxylase [Candidatus Aminicenantes bacterium]